MSCNVQLYKCIVMTVYTVSECVCVLLNIFVYVNGIVDCQAVHPYELQRTRNESGNGDDPRGL